MSRAIRLLAVLTLALTLPACALFQRKEPLVEVQVVEVPVRQYVEMPPELLLPCPIATGPLREAPKVARKRKASLEACNGDKAAMRELQDKALKESRGK